MLQGEDEVEDNRPFKRMLTTDTIVVVPVNKIVRVQVTAADVLHSWAVPSFSVKTDAVPGRLNETWFKADKNRYLLWNVFRIMWCQSSINAY